MKKIDAVEVINRFAPFKLNELKLLTPIEQLGGLLLEESQKPKSIELNEEDPNDFYIAPKQNGKKQLLGAEEEENQERKKHYRPGIFALFYQINEGQLNKEEEVWYYREGKDIVGPVSSYNMDKLAFLHKLGDQTRVAFKTIDKFIRMAKLKKIVVEETGNDV